MTRREEEKTQANWNQPRREEQGDEKQSEAAAGEPKAVAIKPTNPRERKMSERQASKQQAYRYDGSLKLRSCPDTSSPHILTARPGFQSQAVSACCKLLSLVVVDDKCPA